MKLKTLLTCSTVLFATLPLQAQSMMEESKTEAASIEKLNITVASFSGGGWGASRKASVALNSLESVDSIIMSGTTAIIKVKPDAEVDKSKLKKAFKEQKLKLESFKTKEISKPTLAYEMNAKGVGWADSCEKAREALEKIEGIEVAVIAKTSKIYLSEELELTEEILNKKLRRSKITVSNISKSESAEL